MERELVLISSHWMDKEAHWQKLGEYEFEDKMKKYLKRALLLTNIDFQSMNKLELSIYYFHAIYQNIRLVHVPCV